MKKRIAFFTIISVVFALLTVACVFTLPLWNDYSLALYGKAGYAGFSEAVLAKIPSIFAYMFEFNGRVHSSFILFFSILFIGLIFFIVHLIVLAKKKHFVSLLVVILSVLLYCASALFIAVTFRAGLLANDVGVRYSGLTAIFGYVIALWKVGAFQWYFIPVAYAPYLLGGLSVLMMMIAQICDMVYINRHAVATSEYAEVESDVAIDEDARGEEIKSMLNEEIAKAKEANAIVTPLSGDPTSQYRGPILVQYINTFDPKAAKTAPATEENESEDAEKAEPQPENKPLTADDIRRIIQEEFARREEEKAKAEEKTVKEKKKEEKLSAEEVKESIKKEMANFEAKRAAMEAENAKLLAEKKREIQIAEEEANRLKMEKEAAEQAIADLRTHEDAAKADKEAAEGLNAQNSMPNSQERVAPTVGVSAEDIRDIIRAELAGFMKAQPVEEKKEEKKAPVVEKQEEVPAKRVVGAFNPNLPPHDKIIRIPFPTRILSGSDEMKSNYNELKAEILSYGVKDRVSNSGDTFRLHRVTFVKIAIAGKGLKMYMALDPKDYEKSTIPVSDVGHKNIYKDTPLVFKVKSDLSMKRAKQLIADVMKKHGLSQGKVKPNNYALELQNIVMENDADEAEEGEE